MFAAKPDAVAARGHFDTAICLGAMLIGFAIDSRALPFSPALCSDAANPLEAVRLHLALFPAMHLAMGLALLGLWAARRTGTCLREACLGGIAGAALLFGGMHLGAGVAGAWLGASQGWLPMLACMVLGMQLGAACRHLLPGALVQRSLAAA